MLVMMKAKAPTYSVFLKSFTRTSSGPAALNAQKSPASVISMAIRVAASQRTSALKSPKPESMYWPNTLVNWSMTPMSFMHGFSLSRVSLEADQRLRRIAGRRAHEALAQLNRARVRFDRARLLECRGAILGDFQLLALHEKGYL